MNIQEYHNLIIDKYKNGEYKIKSKKGISTPIISQDNLTTYVHDYLIYEWMLDHKDDRWKNMIEFILVPDGVNKEGCDIDFTKMNFKDFYTFLITLKNI